MAISTPNLVAAAILLLVVHFLRGPSVLAERCSSGAFVYGRNELVDELLACSLSKSFDLDLTPAADHGKATPKALVEHGLSNRTSILHARLSGVWTARRPAYIGSGWLCDGTRTTSTSVVELSSLSLEVVEKIEATMSRNQHRLSAHRPCRTFELPLWMCRQTKPIYRTISTWVNRAYYNLTLVQESSDARPYIARLSTMFTCPESFKQRITYSPSATHLLTRHAAHSAASTGHRGQPARKPVKREPEARGYAPKSGHAFEDIPLFGHASSFTTTQSSNMPSSALYQNSVRVVEREATRVLQSALRACLDSLEVDLSLLADYQSFERSKYEPDDGPGHEADEAYRETTARTGIANECSSREWTRSRIELANQLSSLASNSPEAAAYPAKRNQINQAERPDESQRGELLNPYGFYNDLHYDQMID